MFRDILDDRHLVVIIKYILFLRLLCQDIVSKEDVVSSQVLIEEFSNEFQALFGRESMTYNLHAHLHLPTQVWRYGPLNKSSAFPFESIFQLSGREIHGTRNFDGQIARNAEKRQNTKIKLGELFKSCGSEIKFFISEFLLKNAACNKGLIINPRQVQIQSLTKYEIDLLSAQKFTDI